MDISTLRHSLTPVRHVLETPQCQRSNCASHILLASVHAELLVSIHMVFTGEFLLNLKTGISTPRLLFMPVRCVSESPRCQLSNSTSHILLAFVSTELQAAMEMVITGEFLLTLKTDISTPRHLLTPVRHVPESSRCQHSNGVSHILLVPVTAKV
ncbi:hypothetical protein L873DRAFT_1795111 [Choiromyces venosus 120613-1]|uniref:Uncharacterized protein n=1 Tax=Choiromyces venosus 120613-1 TaxID=1336337 RepID=A0A3N4IZ03_9PEZI|nr:hypothetical protein L873DRAFT_1795111 [Choiromyces venosus 120613-1]